MTSPRDFVFDDQGEMLPSDSAAAAARRKELGIKPKPPTRPDQQVSGAKPAAKAKPAIVTKEELAKSGLSLRDYLNKQRGLTRRDGKAPEKAKPAAKASGGSRPKASGAMIQSMDTDTMRAGSRAAAKQSGANRKPAVTAEKPKALAISPRVLKQREADEKKRAERREFGRQRDADKKAADKASFKSLRNDPKQKELRAKRESETKMSSGQRSAARGAKIKEFFGMKKGGAVCMASKRADGIAVKGKTRGKVY